MSCAAPADPPNARDSSALTLTPLDSIKTSGAEIGAFDPKTQRLFVTDALGKVVNLIDASNPAQLTNLGSIDVSALGSPTSVAVNDGIVAVAVAASPDKTQLGHVAFYQTTGEWLSTLTVDSLPDMLTFSPDGKLLLVANEGEPNGYGMGFIDPEGSISLIRIPASRNKIKDLDSDDVTRISFAQYNGQEAALRAQGIRIYGPGSNAAQDFEPEYIAITADSRKAFVTLQENNAVAEIDIATAKVTRLLPLGYKDLNKAPYTVATYEWSNDTLPTIGSTAAGQPLKLGGFSGLTFEGVTADGKLEFITNTDRGPNGEPIGAQRPFLLPQFSPRLVRFTLDTASGKFDLVEQIPLRDSDGRSLTGLPNTAIAGGTTDTPYNDEVPIDLFGQAWPWMRMVRSGCRTNTGPPCITSTRRVG